MKLETSEKTALTAALRALEIARHELAGLPALIAGGRATTAYAEVVHARQLVADIIGELAEVPA